MKGCSGELYVMNGDLILIASINGNDAYCHNYGDNADGAFTAMELIRLGKTVNFDEWEGNDLEFASSITPLFDGMQLVYRVNESVLGYGYTDIYFDAGGDAAICFWKKEIANFPQYIQNSFFAFSEGNPYKASYLLDTPKREAVIGLTETWNAMAREAYKIKNPDSFLREFEARLYEGHFYIEMRRYESADGRIHNIGM